MFLDFIFQITVQCQLDFSQKTVNSFDKYVKVFSYLQNLGLKLLDEILSFVSHTENLYSLSFSLSLTHTHTHKCVPVPGCRLILLGEWRGHRTVASPVLTLKQWQWQDEVGLLGCVLPSGTGLSAAGALVATGHRGNWSRSSSNVSAFPLCWAAIFTAIFCRPLGMLCGLHHALKTTTIEQLLLWPKYRQISHTFKSKDLSSDWPWDQRIVKSLNFLLDFLFNLPHMNDAFLLVIPIKNYLHKSN